MTGRDKGFLAEVCEAIESRFPGVTAAYEGFRTPDLGGPRDGYLVVEVFNVAADDFEALLSFAEDWSERHFAEGGGLTVFGTWTPEETAEHFSADVQAVLAARSPSWQNVDSVFDLISMIGPPAGDGGTTLVSDKAEEVGDEATLGADTELAKAA